jgi:peptidoglycan hydrolase CwlO-like protein
MEKINREIEDLNSKIDKASKKVDPKYGRVDLIDKGIKEIQKYMETTTAGAMKEKENIRKIKFLKESKEFI